MLVEKKLNETMERLQISISSEENEIIDKYLCEFNSKADFVRRAIRQYEQNERKVEISKTLDLILENQLAIEKLLRQQVEASQPEEVEKFIKPEAYSGDDIEDLPYYG